MPIVQPNEYQLTGTHLKVVYSTLGPTLAYTAQTSALAPGSTASFSGSEITTQAVAIGTLVTVSIRHTIDTGGTLFSILIPNIELPSAAATQAFRTIGIYTAFKGPDSFPLTGDRDSYTTIALSGVASCTQPHIVPLYAVPIHAAMVAGDVANMKQIAAQADALKATTPEVAAAVADLKDAIAKAGG
jgi:hypothetical protein